MTDIIKNIALRLKISRKASGYKTSREFAQTHAIPLSTYCQHETGKRQLSIEQLFHYAKITQTEPAWLLTGKGSPCGEGGDKIIEHKILDAQEKLGNTGQLNVFSPLISVEDRFSYVNVKLFNNILHELIPIIHEIPDLHLSNVIDFCFDLYNKIITLNSDEKERREIIKICLKSFLEGLEIKGIDELFKKVKHLDCN